MTNPRSKIHSHLTPDRRRQRDFFIADFLDVAHKDDIASMEHPVFALKAGDHRVRAYERNGTSIIVKPGSDGLATIHDKDVWIFCISQLVEAINRGCEDTSRTVHFTAHNFLVTTNRGTSGRSYERLGNALSRLRSTTIETNITTDGMRERRGFGLVDAWRVVEHGPEDRMVAIEVTLPDWLYRSVQAMEVLTISPDYFRIRKPLDRRIYELARKHCGKQRHWKVSLTVLLQKSGSTTTLREFRKAVRSLVASNELPDYRLAFDTKSDMVSMYRRRTDGRIKELTDLLRR